MIINQEGMRYTYNGMTYTVGAAVMATEASEYRDFMAPSRRSVMVLTERQRMIRMTSIAVLNHLCYKKRSKS